MAEGTVISRVWVRQRTERWYLTPSPAASTEYSVVVFVTTELGISHRIEEPARTLECAGWTSTGAEKNRFMAKNTHTRTQ